MIFIYITYYFHYNSNSCSNDKKNISLQNIFFLSFQFYYFLLSFFFIPLYLILVNKIYSSNCSVVVVRWW